VLKISTFILYLKFVTFFVLFSECLRIFCYIVMVENLKWRANRLVSLTLTLALEKVVFLCRSAAVFLVHGNEN
jgi:hypothetical protein